MQRLYTLWQWKIWEVSSYNRQSSDLVQFINISKLVLEKKHLRKKGICLLFFYKIIYTKNWIKQKTYNRAPATIFCAVGGNKKFKKKKKLKRFVNRWCAYRPIFFITESLFKMGSRESFRNFYLRYSCFYDKFIFVFIKTRVNV